MPRPVYEAQLPIAIAALTLAGVLYNAVLAFLGTLGLPLSSGVVALVETAILGCAMVLLLYSRLGARDLPSLAFLQFSAIIAITVSMMAELLFPNGLRNALIIGLFAMLGERMDRTMLKRFFLVATLLVLAFLVVEMVSSPLYVKLFEPANYYEKTRGVEQFVLDDSGLFRSALGFQGRFTFGLLSHRASSLFIEQVSLANYAAVLCILLLSLWSSMKWWTRLFYLASVAIILLSNSSRTASALAAVSIAGFFIYRLLPRYLNAAVPIVALAVAAVIAAHASGQEGDDLVGRITLTMRHIGSIDLPAMLGSEIWLSGEFMDSGYPYVIYSSTIFGMIALWLYVSFILPQRSVGQRRCAYALSVYIFVNLLIGGTAIFSMKVAAPLWLLVGHMRRLDDDEPAQAAAERDNSIETRSVLPA